MGILRTDILSHSQLPDGNQSVEFDGTGDYLQVPASAAWRLGSANLAHKSVTIEWWVYLNSLSSHAAFGLNALSGMIAYGTNGRYQIIAGGNSLINESNSVLDAVGLNEWHHYALVLHGGGAGARKNVEFYRDGKFSVSNTYAANVAVGDSTHVLTIGVDQENNSSYLNGFISNFRWSDEIVYTSEFTVPKFKLKALPSTMLLCCQSSTSVTEAAVSVSGSVTSNGDPAVSAFGPGLKDDITDTGVVFDGVTTFDSQAYMVPPSGKTTERNRGRGLWGGGWNSPSITSANNIDFIQIQSGGIAKDFGDLIAGGNQIRGVSSSTRGVFLGGRRPHPGVVNTMDFITIATTANALDFGDLLTGRGAVGEISSQTRGIAAAGYNPGNTNTIEFITIATLGNSQDFGDTLSAGSAMAGTQSSTRGILAGNYAPSSPNTSNVIQFLTIATTGNTQDFGDLTDSRHSPSGTSNGIRAVFAAGTHLSPGNNNTMDFVTIASTGNATDFGDLLTVSTGQLGATSDKIRGVFGGGSNSPLYHDNIQQVIISTTGNSVDIGDLTLARLQSGCVSDSHGGLE